MYNCTLSLVLVLGGLGVTFTYVTCISSSSAVSEDTISSIALLSDSVEISPSDMATKDALMRSYERNLSCEQ